MVQSSPASPKLEQSVSYTYQSYNPITDRTDQTQRVETTSKFTQNNQPDRSSSFVRNPRPYSYAVPSSYSSSIHAMPSDPNDPDTLNLQNLYSRNLSHPDYPNRAPHYPIPKHKFPTELDNSNIFQNARMPYSQIFKHYNHDDETINGRKIFKNPRNVPSEHCPRDEEAAKRMVSFPLFWTLGGRILQILSSCHFVILLERPACYSPLVHDHFLGIIR